MFTNNSKQRGKHLAHSLPLEFGCVGDIFLPHDTL